MAAWDQVIMKSIRHADLMFLAKQAGLSILAVTDASPLDEDKKRLESWQEAGFAGTMEYMKRDAALLSDPRRLLESAKTVLVLGLAYDRTPAPTRTSGFGRVARYAWGRDYHLVIPKRLKHFVGTVSSALGAEISWRGFSDAVPLMERALARRGGLGFIGKNTLLIVPGKGSFLFLAEIVWDLEVCDLPALAQAGSCGACSRCRPACPTNAIVADRSLDATRCISYLTIEKRGGLLATERKAIGEWIFGCDICQEVCPFNHTSLNLAAKPDCEEFAGQRFPGPLLDLSAVLQLRRDQDFRQRFAGSAMLRTKREGLLRNAALVAANTQSEQNTPDLLQAFEHDSSEIVRSHALWALFELELSTGCVGKQRLNLLLAKGAVDQSPLVASEARDLQLRA